ncbi:arrestin domain-containing protein 3 [Chanos chanos]|uniref:Arrestin domain-containing protein 3 n=1 Tax=Chanos chanos TaxID=29144 RepID=A0A6J2VV10_CHACN|nr:arrestin domain-containing protein 3-like [Chanos chanos]
MPGKDLSIRYDPINEANTFSRGDFVKGRVILELNKEIKADAFFVKLKGDANVRWTERHNDKNRTYSAHERYFKLKHYFIREGSEAGGSEVTCGDTYSNVVPPGTHVYEFCFQIPQGLMPPSFKGHHGKITYRLEAKLSRSWKFPLTASTELQFVSRPDGTELTVPLAGEANKEMSLFTSGSVSMKANTEKMAYMQGELVIVTAAVKNSSSRPLKIKYSLQQRLKYIASGSSKTSSHYIFKEVGDPIPTGQNQTITKELQLPSDVQPSIVHCKIIKLEYTLKVYLDVPYASDPEIVFPLVILPRGQFPLSTPSRGPFGAGQPGWNGPPTHNAAGPYPDASASGVYPSPTAPGPYQHHFTPSMQPEFSNPNAPPPTYSELYPTPSAPALYPNLPPPTAQGFYPAPSAPGQYPNPNGSGSFPVPTAPGYNPPPYSTTGNPVPSAPEYCPDPYPTKTPQ